MSYFTFRRDTTFPSTESGYDSLAIPFEREIYRRSESLDQGNYLNIFLFKNFEHFLFLCFIQLLERIGAQDRKDIAEKGKKGKSADC